METEDLRSHWSQQEAHLADNVPVGEADNHPVLRCVVLVLILNHKALTSKEVGLSLWKEENAWRLIKTRVKATQV